MFDVSIFTLKRDISRIQRRSVMMMMFAKNIILSDINIDTTRSSEGLWYVVVRHLTKVQGQQSTELRFEII